MLLVVNIILFTTTKKNVNRDKRNNFSQTPILFKHQCALLYVFKIF